MKYIYICIFPSAFRLVLFKCSTASASGHGAGQLSPGMSLCCVED